MFLLAEFILTRVCCTSVTFPSNITVLRHITELNRKQHLSNTWCEIILSVTYHFWKIKFNVRHQKIPETGGFLYSLLPPKYPPTQTLNQTSSPRSGLDGDRKHGSFPCTSINRSFVFGESAELLKNGSLSSKDGNFRRYVSNFT